MIIAIRAQSTRRTSMTFFQQASRCGTFSAGLLTRRPDANTFPKHMRVWHSFPYPRTQQEMRGFSGSFVRARYKGGSQLRDSWGLSPHSLLIAQLPFRVS